MPYFVVAESIMIYPTNKKYRSETTEPNKFTMFLNTES